MDGQGPKHVISSASPGTPCIALMTRLHKWLWVLATVSFVLRSGGRADVHVNTLCISGLTAQHSACQLCFRRGGLNLSGPSDQYWLSQGRFLTTWKAFVGVRFIMLKWFLSLKYDMREILKLSINKNKEIHGQMETQRDRFSKYGCWKSALYYQLHVCQFN